MNAYGFKLHTHSLVINFFLHKELESNNMNFLTNKNHFCVYLHKGDKFKMINKIT